MAGRPSKPTQLIKLEGKSHRTKKELEAREKAEQSLYTGIKFKESPAVKSDPVAHKEFLRLKKLYKHIEYIDGLDEQIINRYCKMVSQEQTLQQLIENLNNSIVQCENEENKNNSFKILNSTIGKLNQTRDMILKLEDRLFLNPTARVKAIPKTPPDDKSKHSRMADFLDKKVGGGRGT